jgi:uncharacterized protein (TIGR03437 family)
LNGSTQTAAISLVAQVVVSAVGCTPTSLNSGASSTCTVTISKVAPTGGTVVTISDNNTLLTVPASVTVAAGATTGSFTATAGTVTTTQSVTISASLNGVTSTTLTIQPSGTTGPAGLMSAYGFDEGTGTAALDGSSNGHTATLVGGPAWTTGRFGGAISADGMNDFVSIPPIDLSGTSAVTVSMWVRRTYSINGGHTLFEATANSNNSTTGFGLFPDDSTCRGILLTLHGNNGTNGSCFAQPSSGVWHHLAAVYNTKGQIGTRETALYIDGVLQGTTRNYANADNRGNFGNNEMYLFSRGGVQQFTAATVDELRIYSRALSKTEIQADMNTAVRSYAPASAGTVTTMAPARMEQGTPAESAAAADDAPLSLSCSSHSVAAGTWSRCELHAAPDPVAREIHLTSTSDQVKVPATITTRPNQSRLTFRVFAEPAASQQSAIIAAETGDDRVEETILVEAAKGPVLSVPESQMSRIGSATKFTVGVVDPAGLPVQLAAAALPSGAVFDADSGRFEWTPLASQSGRSEVVFTAVNSARQSTSAAVTFEVDSGVPVLDSSKPLVCSPGAVANLSGKWLVDPAVGSTRVKVNGEEMTVLHASAATVEFLCPMSEPGTALSATVEVEAAKTEAVSAAMREAAPRILRVGAWAGDQGLVSFPASSELAMDRNYRIPARPAQAGDSVRVWVSGLGSRLDGLSLSIGDVVTELESVEAVEGYPGVYAAQARVPQAARLGVAVPVFLQIDRDGRQFKSNQVTVVVEEAQ